MLDDACVNELDCGNHFTMCTDCTSSHHVVHLKYIQFLSVIHQQSWGDENQ